MKKFLLMAAISAALCTTAVSCGDDDDDVKGGVVPSPSISDFDGVRLLSVGEYTSFNYNSDGTLHQVINNGDKLTFDYGKGIITFSGDGVQQEAKFTTNAKGYITSLSASGTDEDGDDKYQYNTTYKFQYNSSDHLTNVVLKEVYTYNNTNYNEVEDVTWNLTWNGDLLAKVDINGTSVGNGETEKWNSVAEYTYNNALDNRYMQYTGTVIDEIDLDGDIEAPIFVGVLGKGPAKYPSKIVNLEDDGYSIEYVLEYILNSKGLVERETCTSKDIYEENTLSNNYVYTSFSKATSYGDDTNSRSVKPRHRDGRKHISLFGRRK